MRAVPRRFLTGPVGCELTGPEFTPDGRTLFLSVQHPGEDGGLAEPTSLFPHDALGIPRPSVVAIEREDGAAFG
jgi:secreted PhoX family phosphatase